MDDQTFVNKGGTAPATLDFDGIEEIGATMSGEVVEHLAAVLPAMPLLGPSVKRAVEQILDPEARSVAERAQKAITGSAEGAESKEGTKAETSAAFKAVLGEKVGSDDDAETTLDHVSSLASMATKMHCFDSEASESGVGCCELFAPSRLIRPARSWRWR